MDVVFTGETISQRIRSRLVVINREAANTVGGALQMELLASDENAGRYRMRCITREWMRNVIGTLHGGSCAIMADQAMGCVANCLYDSGPHSPTSQLQLNFHRPMIAGKTFLIEVQLINVSHSMIHLTAQIFAEAEPDKLCVSSSSVFFRGKKKEDA